MARVNSMTFDKRFCLEFLSVARGHHIYKKIWTPVKGEKLASTYDSREEAKLYDDYAVGIYLDEGEGIEKKTCWTCSYRFIIFTMQIFSLKRMSSQVFSNGIKVLGRRTCGSL